MSSGSDHSCVPCSLYLSYLDEEVIHSLENKYITYDSFHIYSLKMSKILAQINKGIWHHFGKRSSHGFISEYRVVFWNLSCSSAIFFFPKLYLNHNIKACTVSYWNWDIKGNNGTYFSHGLWHRLDVQITASSGYAFLSFTLLLKMQDSDYLTKCVYSTETHLRTRFHL